MNGNEEIVSKILVQEMKTNVISVENINVQRMHVASIEFIRAFGNASSVYLDHNQVSNLEPLADLRAIRKLGLISNCIGDIGPLKGLTQLRELFLSNNPIQNLAALSHLYNLHQLWLENVACVRAAKNIGKLFTSQALQILSLDNNLLVDPIISQRDFPSLRRLSLENNRIKTLAGLRTLRQLEFLHARGNPLASSDEMVFIFQNPLMELKANFVSRNDRDLEIFLEHMQELKDFECRGFVSSVLQSWLYQYNQSYQLKSAITEEDSENARIFYTIAFVRDHFSYLLKEYLAENKYVRTCHIDFWFDPRF